jgi:1-deoxy-D-xylulose-5-phosphate synthase
VIVHARLEGQRIPQAETDYYRWHATGPFDLATGRPIKGHPSSYLHDCIWRHALPVNGKDPKVVALTATMPDGTGVCSALKIS